MKNNPIFRPRGSFSRTIRFKEVAKRICGFVLFGLPILALPLSCEADAVFNYTIHNIGSGPAYWQIFAYGSPSCYPTCYPITTLTYGYLAAGATSSSGFNMACYAEPFTAECRYKSGSVPSSCTDGYGGGIVTEPSSVSGTYYVDYYIEGALVNDPNDISGDPSNTNCDKGMPVWSVSDPYISLWLKDEPLGYQPALGPRISLQLAFKQREFSSGFDTNTFSVGKKWNCSWLSYVSQDVNKSNVVYFAGGGQVTFYGTNNYLTETPPMVSRFHTQTEARMFLAS
jgi:hypothetical protein